MKTLSIVLEDNLYYDLKKKVPARKISKFISDSIEKEIQKKADALAQEYIEDAKDKALNKEIRLWSALDAEGWE